MTEFYVKIPEIGELELDDIASLKRRLMNLLINKTNIPVNGLDNDSEGVHDVQPGETIRIGEVVSKQNITIPDNAIVIELLEENYNKIKSTIKKLNK